MISNYHLMCFTLFVEDPGTQFKMGYSLQFIVIFAIGVNIAKMLWVMFKKGESKMNKKKNQTQYEDNYKKMQDRITERAEFLI